MRVQRGIVLVAALGLFLLGLAACGGSGSGGGGGGGGGSPATGNRWNSMVWSQGRWGP